MQTTTPLSLLTLPSKDALTKEFVGRNINALRTPALIVDRSVFKKNCERVTKETERRGMGFRAHVKSESKSQWARREAS
jgi:D-serine deaminase-like pyridoxal phosphate-dependent protein